MLRPARLASHAVSRRAALTEAVSHSLTGIAWRRKKTLVLAGTALALAGTALALAGTGSATAATVGGGSAAGHPAPQHPAPQHPAASAAQLQAVPLTWQHVRDAINWQTNPAAAQQGRLPFADRLMPAGTSGPQSWMPVSAPQPASATTIVQQTLARRMGIRSAVTAVATAMQESRLQDLGYDNAGSLGLFQQRPSMGWGTAQQIMNPVYASDAFLTQLQQYQAASPGWAAQPLWASAQAVQRSGFPYAYAQWEMQAAGLVKQIAMSLQP